ncbi:BspA family leucine-rich repeat surface protein [Lactobacillus sp. LC28-10]|uniref:BspA family leucine-rich repeat surface protein n=1 Tax=Secundilactobacillus angelensis TaxID=2722706 RepID=A0ABX1L1Q5_9LACO|nr:BspA family leucine-rich repeat surface protein [Secundilactobacillus angelensis]MCH5462651.1 BspA family leucine-rich repeat surface protein [Secundilactobacillus angelensis]NLR19143.1 BspA family leucine-rich repeat surface protein [Secundilactobacillus angelensis]
MTEKAKKAAQKLQWDEREIKVRRKLYKSGKIWLAASLASAVLGATMIGSELSANADTAEPVSHTQTQADSEIQGKTVTLGTSTNEDQTTGAPLKSQAETAPQSEQSSTVNAVNSDKSGQVQNTDTDSTGGTVGTNIGVTKADSSATTDSINLGNADAETISNAKETASKIYQQTGKAQQITAVAAEATGTIGTSPYQLSDDGALTIQAGELTQGVYTIGSDNVNSIQTISVGDDVIAKLDGAYGALFGNLPNVTAIDVHNLDISGATGFGGWFTNNTKLQQINVTGWDTSHSTVFANMFFNNQALNGVDLSSFDTSNAVDMHSMFQSSGIRTIDLSKFDMSKATNITDMLQGTTNLWQIKLGPKVNLTGTGLVDAPAAGTKIVDGDNTYTTAAPLWQAVGGGTVNAPEGERLSAADLIKKYNGDGTAPTETYVWAQDLNNTINLIDATNGQKLDTTTVSGEYGASLDLSTSLPVGYHYATGSELGTYTQPVAPTIGKNDAAIDVYVVVDPKITVNFVDDDAQDTVVQTAEQSGQLGTVSDYDSATDLAALEQKGYEYVSDDLPDGGLSFNAQTASYTVHVKHKLTTVKGTDSTATANQQKAISVIIDESTIGTPLTPEQVKPEGDTTQTLIYVRDVVIDEAKKAAGAPASEYTSYGNWYTNQKLTPVVSAEVEGYSPLAFVVDLETQWDETRTINQILADFAAQSPGSATVTLHNSYRINQYPIAIQYVDQTTGQTVGTVEKLRGDYGTQLVYPAIAPSGYVLVPGQDEIVNNKVTITFGPDVTALTIKVTPEITNQLATVTYQTESGTTVALETFNGDSGSEIAFDTSDYVAQNLSAYEIKTDATTAGATYDKLSDSVQNFKVVVALKPISTLITPTGIDGQPIEGATAVAITGQPGADITTIPDVDGYTAIPDQTLRFPQINNDVTKVYYVANNLFANVQFVDENGSQLANLSVSGIKNGLLDHANVATVTQQILKQGYNLISDGTVGGSFDGTTDQIFTVKLAKLADVQTTQTATIKFVSDEPNNFGTLIMTGDSGSGIDHHNIATVIQQILNQGFNLAHDGSVGALFDSDPNENQMFTVSFDKIADKPQTDTSTPGQPIGGGGTTPEGPNGGIDNPGGPGEGSVTPPTGPIGSETNIPEGPNTSNPTPPTTTPSNPVGDTVPTMNNNDTEGDSTTSSNDASVTSQKVTVPKAQVNSDGQSEKQGLENQHVTLPQTDENSRSDAVMGIGLLTMVMGLVGIKLKRKNE